MTLYISNEVAAEMLLVWTHFSESELKNLYFLLKRNPMLIPHLADFHARQNEIMVERHPHKIEEYKRAIYSLLESIQESTVMPRFA
jgi:hypothetical protein